MPACRAPPACPQGDRIRSIDDTTRRAPRLSIHLIASLLPKGSRSATCRQECWRSESISSRFGKLGSGASASSRLVSAVLPKGSRSSTCQQGCWRSEPISSRFGRLGSGAPLYFLRKWASSRLVSAIVPSLCDRPAKRQRRVAFGVGESEDDRRQSAPRRRPHSMGFLNLRREAHIVR